MTDSLREQLERTGRAAEVRGDLDAADFIRGVLSSFNLDGPPTLDVTPRRLERVQQRYGCNDPLRCVMRGFHSDVR